MRLYDARPRYAPCELEDGPLDYDTAADVVARIHARQRAAAAELVAEVERDGAASYTTITELVRSLDRSLADARALAGQGVAQ